MLAGRGQCIVEHLEAACQPGQECRAEFRGFQLAPPAVEHGASKALLGLEHVLAYGPDRHAELIGSLLQRAEPARRLERTQPVEVDAVQLLHAVFLHRSAAKLHGNTRRSEENIATILTTGGCHDPVSLECRASLPSAVPAFPGRKLASGPAVASRPARDEQPSACRSSDQPSGFAGAAYRRSLLSFRATSPRAACSTGSS